MVLDFDGRHCETYSGADIGAYLQDATERLKINNFEGYINDGDDDVIMVD
jgi:hypothetical protein